MFLAVNDGGRRVKPEPKHRAACPACRSGVIAKCGRVVTWHWAHESGTDCDPWSEMTQWHLDWQEKWPESQREFVIGEHRADVCTVPQASLVSTMATLSPGEPLVVEFQHSYLDAGAIDEREAYYEAAAGQMIWVWDARKAAAEGRLFVHSNSRIFTWKHFRSSMTACQFPVFLDVGGSLLFIHQWPRKEWIVDYERDSEYGSGGRWGWGDGVGQPLSTREFVRALTLGAVSAK